MTEKELDCRQCGACCVADFWNNGKTEPFVELTYDEIESLTRLWRKRLTHFHLPIIQTDNENRCQALRGTVGKRVSCRIYDRRPASCSEFEPGGETCRDARAAILEKV